MKNTLWGFLLISICLTSATNIRQPSYADLCASAINSSLAILGIQWDIVANAKPHLVTHKTLYTPDYALKIKIKFLVHDRVYAEQRGKIFNNVPTEDLPPGGFSWVLTDKGELSYGMIENSWEFGVKHIHVANERPIVLAGELFKNSVSDGGGIKINVMSGTYTKYTSAALAKVLSNSGGTNIISSHSNISNSSISSSSSKESEKKWVSEANELLMSCGEAVFTEEIRRNSKGSLTEQNRHVEVDRSMHALTSIAPITVHDIHDICISMPKFRIQYSMLCSRYKSWENYELDSIAVELKRLSTKEATTEASSPANHETRWLRLHSAQNAEVVVYHPPASTAVEAVAEEKEEDGKKDEMKKRPIPVYFPNGLYLVEGRRADARDMIPWQGMRYKCPDGVSHHYFLSITQGFIYTPERGLHNASIMIPRRPACLLEMFEEIVDNSTERVKGIAQEDSESSQETRSTLFSATNESNHTQWMQEMQQRYNALAVQYPWPRQLIADVFGLPQLCGDEIDSDVSDNSNNNTNGSNNNVQAAAKHFLRRRRHLLDESEQPPSVIVAAPVATHTPLHQYHHHHHHPTHHYNHDNATSSRVSHNDRSRSSSSNISSHQEQYALNLNQVAASPARDNLFVHVEGMEKEKVGGEEEEEEIEAEDARASKNKIQPLSPRHRLAMYQHCTVVQNQFGEPLIVSDLYSGVGQ